MTNSISVRPARADDTQSLADIADATLFPGEMLPEMIAGYLNQTDDALWLTAERNGAVIGFAFATPEEMTDRVWNLKAIATHPGAQRQGAGRALLRGFESAVQDRARMVVMTPASWTIRPPGARCMWRAVMRRSHPFPISGSRVRTR